MPTLVTRPQKARCIQAASSSDDAGDDGGGLFSGGNGTMEPVALTVQTNLVVEHLVEHA